MSLRDGMQLTQDHMGLKEFLGQESKFLEFSTFRLRLHHRCLGPKSEQDIYLKNLKKAFILQKIPATYYFIHFTTVVRGGWGCCSYP